jgi:tRNA threonylcarbamoyladenosine biosynthesis protein TsaB
MKILALEAATSLAGLAVVGDGLFNEFIFTGSRENGDRIMVFMDRFLKDSNLELKDINLLAVGIGPGLYTGLRVGFSLMKGLSLALALPLIGISTFDSIAYNFLGRREKVLVLLQAYGGEAYGAVYEVDTVIRRKGGYRVAPIEDILRGVEGKVIVAGAGIDIYRKDIKGSLGDRAIIASSETWMPRPGSLARLSEERFKKGRLPHPDRILPLYLKKSEAEIKWERYHSHP